MSQNVNGMFYLLGKYDWIFGRQFPKFQIGL